MLQPQLQQWLGFHEMNEHIFIVIIVKTIIETFCNWTFSTLHYSHFGITQNKILSAINTHLKQINFHTP